MFEVFFVALAAYRYLDTVETFNPGATKFSKTAFKIFFAAKLILL